MVTVRTLHLCGWAWRKEAWAMHLFHEYVIVSWQTPSDDFRAGLKCQWRRIHARKGAKGSHCPEDISLRVEGRSALIIQYFQDQLEKPAQLRGHLHLSAGGIHVRGLGGAGQASVRMWLVFCRGTLLLQVSGYCPWGVPGWKGCGWRHHQRCLLGGLEIHGSRFLGGKQW